MQFEYVAYGAHEGTVRGKIEARNQDEAWQEITLQGYRPLRVTTARRLPGLEELFPTVFKVGTGELVRFSRQLATMLNAGGSLVPTLQMFRQETRNRAMRPVLDSVIATVSDGKNLSTALADHPTVFSPLYVSIVEVGEYTGRLGPALDQMAEILEKDREAKQRAIRTMMYPMAIVGLSMLSLGVLVTVALPPLLKSFERLDTEPPLLTRIAVALFGGITENILFIAIGLIVVVAGVIFGRRVPWIREKLDIVQARSPILGPIVVSGELARFSRTIAMLLEAGVPLMTGLQLGITGCKNRIIRRAFLDGEESLTSGHGLSDALKRHSILPGIFVQLVVIGEESNSLELTMNDAANSYQAELEQNLNTLLGILEPASTLFVGGIVGFIAFSMFVPIYSGLDALR